MYDIENIQVMYSKYAVEYSQHFRGRMKERNIKYADVRMAILNGEIIEQDLNDVPNPSVLILGYVREGKALHVAVGVDDVSLVLITVYFPALTLWEDDFKTRKVVDLI